MVWRMKRTLVLALATLAVALGFAVPAQAATHSATGIERLDTSGHRIGGYTIARRTPAPLVIRFTRIVYNPPGRDVPAKLNREYVRITNYSSFTVHLQGWKITDRDGHTFVFPTGYTIPGKRPGHLATAVIVHTGHGTNFHPTVRHLYWQSSNFIWNNNGDKATLEGASGRVYDTCTYRPNGGGLTYCI